MRVSAMKNDGNSKRGLTAMIGSKHLTVEPILCMIEDTA